MEQISAQETKKGNFGHGILLYGSNDPEVLVEQCAENLRDGYIDPFQSIEFLVQSRGMGAWLKLQLADRMKIFGRSQFRFPEETIWIILRGFLGGGPAKNPYTKEAMAWKIFGLLPGLIESEPEAFSPLVSYLGQDQGNEDRRFRLCRQVSTQFDSYQTYRPEMIIQWLRGKQLDGEHAWQSILWRKLRAAMGEKSLPELVVDMQRLNGPRSLQSLPPRLIVFGISTLPPVFLDILKSYGEVRLLQIYALQPAPVMWGEVQSEKWKQRAMNRANREGQSGWKEEDLNIESGNPLIGSLGRTGREFFNLLVDRDAHDLPLPFREPEGHSILSSLQRWTFEVFTDRPNERTKFDTSDLSLQVMSCHSPMRETEVLRDYLLRRFADDPTIRPSDILVMMPDPEAYAPYIRATFGGMEDGMPGKFPFSIVDREPRHESQLVDFFFDLLEFFDGRATNTEILDLLDSLPIRTRFELTDDDIDTYRQWIRDCHFHWGFDGEHRKSIGSTLTDEHSWKHAFDRLALGYTMRSHNEHTWSGVLPYDEIEGENSNRFAKLYQVTDLLSSFEKSARRSQGLSEWKSFLDSLSRSFFPQNNDTLLDRQRINQAIHDLGEQYGKLAPNSVVPLRVIRYHLNNVVESGTTRGQFLTRGVTFCGLRPMRSISARMICLIGMNEGAFPRQTQSASFDLSGDRRPGDRSAREDDRYLFLESLWCARDFLYLSYIGQSIRQSEEISPSVVIAELLDALDKVVDFGDRDNRPILAKDVLVKSQSLHPFAVDNFTGGQLPRSFSSDHCLAARALVFPDKQILPFVNSSIPLSTDSLEGISLADLIRFFESPSKYFLVNCLGMSLWEDDPPPQDHEPMSLNNLEKYGVKNRLLGMALTPEPEINFHALEKAKGSLPPGSLGEVWFNEAAIEVDQFIERWGDALVGEYDPPVLLEGIISGLKIRGEVVSVLNGKQVLYRCGATRPKDRLSAWIKHLFACAFLSLDSLETRFFAMDKAKKYLSFDPIPEDQSKELLSKLIEVFQEGMLRPVPFFPASSHAYAKELLKGEGSVTEELKDGALKKARQEWEPSSFSRGGPKERESAENLTCFRDDPIGHPAFAHLAQEVFGPLLDYQREEGEL